MAAVGYAIATTPVQSPPSPSDFLKAYAGRPVFLEFMNPSCPHCVNMVPVLKQLYVKYSSVVAFVSVSFGSVADTQSFIQVYGTPWTYKEDSGGTIFQAFGVSGTPTFFLVTRAGEISQPIVGEISYSSLAAALDQVVSS